MSDELILIAAAVVPALWLLVKIYKADRLEKEPVGLVLLLVALGVLSTVFASITEQLGDLALSYFFPEGTLPYDILMYFIVVAFSEEGFKYLLLKNRSWRSPEFNCLFDGVVYAVAVSLGFALWENIGYVLYYGMGAAVARALTAVPGHACFGVFMGAWYGFAKRRELMGDPERSARCRRMAVLVPALLHGAYDFIAARQTEALTVVFIVFVLAMFIGALRLVSRMSKQDEYMTPQWDLF